MNWKHLLWIIPLTLFIAFLLGYYIGVQSTIEYIRTETGLTNLCKAII